MPNLTFGKCQYSDSRKDVVFIDGRSAGLRKQTVEVFKYLAENDSHVLSREEIQSKVWKDQIVTDDSLSQCISEIRKALADTKRQTLKTVPRRGYMLIADQIPIQPTPVANVNNHSIAHQPSHSPILRPLKTPLIAAALLIATLGLAALHWNSNSDITDKTMPPVAQPLNAEAPTLAVKVNSPTNKFVESVATNTRAALSRYHSVSVVENNPDFTIRLSGSEEQSSLSIELLSESKNQLIFAENLNSINSGNADTRDPTMSLGIRIAGMVASPGGGAIARQLLNSAKSKPVDELTKFECYAYGYDCTNCSGELDPITARAQQCLANILEQHPEDARAWGLQSTIYAHQYLWSTALPEPARTSLKHRSHLTKLAIEAANKAEQFSDGTDTSVYWGMAQAYASACQVEKLRTAVDRGLQINPDDPSLLGAFGSWLAYAGDWNTGVDMINRALEIEPRFYKRWWLFPIAKRHYAKGDYEQALTFFRKAYNERNWLSHLQLAYTLPHLGRLDEAIEERKAFEYLYPGATIENVLQFYKSYCFDDSYLEKLKWALTQAGLPSRGNSDDFNNIQPPEVKVLKVNGFDLEYMDVGTGIPIVFVHGSISDYRAWSHYQNPISENHRYISYSLRYAGSQQWPDDGERYGSATDAEDLIALIEALDIGPVFTVSWSGGGRVSGPAALLRPDLFLGNVHFEPIVGDIANTSDPAVLKVRDEFFARFDTSDQQLAAGQSEKAAATILEIVFELEYGQFATEIMPLRAMNRDAARYSALESSTRDELNLSCNDLSKTKTPTTVVVGENTNAWWTHVVERYHECIPDSQLVIMQDVNHDGPIRDPEELTRLILEFVQRHTTSE